MIIPSLGSGGAERVISSLANHWAINNNCELHIVIFTSVKDFYDINSKVKIHRIEVSSKFSKKIIKLFKLLIELRILIKCIEPDICLSFIRESNIITLLASRGLNTKVIISERDSPNALVSRLYSYLRKKLYPFSDGIIVQTEDYKKFVVNTIGDLNIEVIPNPVRNIITTVDSRENIIISVGRLIPSKGHSYLIDAFSKCKMQENWKLVILGDGLLKDTLDAQIRALNLSNQIQLMGAVKDVDYWLSRASIFAFTSLSEGFPNALAEGMSASLPCVSFDCITGPKELIEDGKNGYLVDLYDVENFAKKLDILMESKSLRQRLGKYAKYTVNNLEFNMVSQRYFMFINKILTSK